MAGKLSSIKLGPMLAGAGALVLAGVLVATGWAAFDRQGKCPPDDAAMPAGAIVHAPDRSFGVNGQFCLAWRPAKYFEKEVAARAGLSRALERAQAEELKAAEAAKAAAAGAPAVAAEAALKVASAARAAAEAKLAEAPTIVEAAVFVDDIQVGKPIKVRLPREGSTEVRWTTIRLRAPEDYASDAAKAWRELLQGVNREGSRPVRVGLGDPAAKMAREGAEVANLKISAFEKSWLLAGLAGFVLLAAGVVMIGWKTAMLRVATPGAAQETAPFSLARVQMVWWFMLTLAGFLFIWLTTGQWIGVMTTSVVGLLGISGISGLAAVAIDAAPDAAGNPPAAEVSRGFWKDILSDRGSIVLHRLQMAAWTVVLGGIFIWSVAWSYALPAFDATLLLLAGVVNGVYLGFKIPENAAKKQTP